MQVPIQTHRMVSLADWVKNILRFFSSEIAAGVKIVSLALFNDEELAARAPGEPDAFAELYRRYVERVYAYHFMRTGTVYDAQDLTSQTFLAALEGISRYRGQGCFAAWLLSIARRKTADYYRRSHIEENIDFIDNRSFPQNDVEDDVEERIRLQHIQHALKSLQPERAEALILRVFSQLRSAEVAEIMQKSDGAVRTLVYRALQDLRQTLGERQEVS